MVYLGSGVVSAKFLRREKRFVVHARLGTRVVRCFLSNTGRLGFLQPGASLLIRKRPTKSRLPYEVLVAFDDTVPVVVDARIPNMVVNEALELHKIDLGQGFSRVRTEKRVDGHRIDFFLEGDEEIYLEVKGCTMALGKLVVYPDAPTQRGQSHLKLLSRLQREGFQTVVLFLAMRNDISSFGVNSDVDPDFAKLLFECLANGSTVIAYSIIIERNRVSLGRKLPFLRWQN